MTPPRPTTADADLGGLLAEITEEAARLILPLWRSGLTVHAKADESPVTVRVIRTDEELMIARSVTRVLGLSTHEQERDA